MSEDRLIALLRGIARHPGARGLMDDAAVLAVPQGDLVLTHDMLVEGVHFQSDDAPADVAWKLVAVNMSDLAAKGATPLGVLTGVGMARDDDWNAAFVAGLGAALGHFGVPLLGGDTVRMPDGAPLTLGLTAIGRAPPGGVPQRGGARPGDDLWVSGTIGDAGLGLALRQRAAREPAALIAAYCRPQPRLLLGGALAPLVTAMMDVSDGLLIDASRMATASGCAVTIALDAVPLSAAARAFAGATLDARLAAATAGDDYVLLFAVDPAAAAELAALAATHATMLTRVGTFAAGQGIKLTDGGVPVPLPAKLGYLHR